MQQHTLAAELVFQGVALHSGAQVRMVLSPRPAGHGITFRRSDCDDGPAIPARIDHVVDTRLATTLGAPAADGTLLRISTVEHVLSALYALGVDNVAIAVDGPEVPVLDGSARAYAEAITRVGRVPQAEASVAWAPVDVVRVEDGEKAAVLSPGPTTYLEVTSSIDFDHPAIPTTPVTVAITPESYVEAIAPARTFGFLRDVEAMRAAGLARGGSLENAVVLDGERVLNPEGMRFSDECGRHKILDALGDLALLGKRLVGRLELRRSGHALHAQLTRRLAEEDALLKRV